MRKIDLKAAGTGAVLLAAIGATAAVLFSGGGSTSGHTPVGDQVSRTVDVVRELPASAARPTATPIAAVSSSMRKHHSTIARHAVTKPDDAQPTDTATVTETSTVTPAPSGHPPVLPPAGPGYSNPPVPNPVAPAPTTSTSSAAP